MEDDETQPDIDTPRPTDLDPYILRLSWMAEGPQDGVNCSGECGTLIFVGETMFYRLDPLEVYCLRCGDSVLPYRRKRVRG